MNKPKKDEPPIVHLGYALCQMSDERKEVCIHCGNEWYSIHYKDGVCHSCQGKGFLGRKALAEKSSSRHLRGALLLVLLVIAFVILL